jgi:hypothetical protein
VSGVFSIVHRRQGLSRSSVIDPQNGQTYLPVVETGGVAPVALESAEMDGALWAISE